MPWAKGQSGNPAGRPPKRQRLENPPPDPLEAFSDPLTPHEYAVLALARQTAEAAADALLQSHANALLQTMVARAQAGSKRAQLWVQEHLKFDQKETTNA